MTNYLTFDFDFLGETTQRDEQTLEPPEKKTGS